MYKRQNLANDHNQLLMAVMKKIARRHCFRLLLHAKPFKGINGSGKHCNWSLGTDTGINLLSPVKAPQENLQFVTFLVNVLMAVYKYNGLLKACISTATNAHRLGANEAPPAIISSFLGSQVSEVLDRIEKSDTEDVIRMDAKAGFHLNGITHIPELLIDNTDRNRTSPFAFTGNRFEFRAVGSSANCAKAMIVLNTAVAEQLTTFKKDVAHLMQQGKSKENAIYSVIKEYIRKSAPIRFDGNGYSEAWKKEAYERGLDCETSIPVILQQFIAPDVVKMFESQGVIDVYKRQLFCRSKQYLEDEAVKVFDTRKELAEEMSMRKTGGVYITTIQKFAETTGLLTERSNVICLSDEAHRSQNNIGSKLSIQTEGEADKIGAKITYGFAKYLRDALPNATYVGFTGTPIDETVHVFGKVEMCIRDIVMYLISIFFHS